MLPASPDKLSLANTPTPIRLLERVSAELGGPRIWLKCDDQTGSVVSGNKIRKLEYLAADARLKGCNTLITCGGIQSNHCRATAAVAAQLGMKCHLILRGTQNQGEVRNAADLLALDTNSRGLDGNLLLDHLCGAKITVLPPRQYFSGLSEEFESLVAFYAENGDRAYPIPTGGSCPMGLWGYVSAAEELMKDFARLSIDPERIVCASGSGGTQGGLTLGFHLLSSESQVVAMAVCDSAAYFDKEIRADVTQWQKRFAPQGPDIASALSITTLEDYMGPGYAIAYPELLECIHWLAREEGVVLDPVYTGKAFYGLTQEIRSGRWKDSGDIVFIHTGGIFGLYPFRAELSSRTSTNY